MKGKIISSVYILYGLIDIAISALSRFILIHMIVLAALCLVAGISLWIKKTWSIYTLIPAGLLTIILGLTTLYTSIQLVGFDSTTQILFNLSLIAYTSIMLGVSIYIAAKGTNKLEM